MMDLPTLGAKYEGKWILNPVYRAAISREVAPGGQTTYVLSRTIRYTEEDFTSFIPGQASWSESNLPPILKIIKPPISWENHLRVHKPTYEQDSAGMYKLENWPELGKAARIVKHFDVLPDQISTTEPGWSIETWMRLDPSIQYEDILMRMPHPGRPLSVNALNMRRHRARNDLDLIVWERRALKTPDLRTQMMLSQMPAHQLAANSTTAALGSVASTPTVANQGNLQPLSSASVPPPIVPSSNPHGLISAVRTALSHTTQILYSQVRCRPAYPAAMQTRSQSQSGQVDEVTALPQASGDADQVTALPEVTRAEHVEMVQDDMADRPATPHPATGRRTNRRGKARESTSPRVSTSAKATTSPKEKRKSMTIETPSAVQEVPDVAQEVPDIAQEVPNVAQEVSNVAQEASSVTEATSSGIQATSSAVQQAPQVYEHPLDRWPITYGRITYDWITFPSDEEE